jgi:5-(carboxyamino)imidazole ribonucleotide mutase
MSFVAIFLGSEKDIEIANHTIDILKEFNIKYVLIISSAHRNPNETLEYIKKYEKASVFIGMAGMSAHLPGFIASHTVKPVIGVPIAVNELRGIDSLLSISQMPSGVPVATVSIGKHGAINAGLLVASILSINNKDIENKIFQYRNKFNAKIVVEAINE